MLVSCKVIVFGCGSCTQQFSRIVDRIVNGEKAEKNEYPWQVRIMRKGYMRCSGVVLNERTILTAAHCYGFDKESFYQILVGTHTTRRPLQTAQKRRVEKVIVHKGYVVSDTYESANDIALFHLKSPLELSSAVQPVRLSDREFDKDALTNKQCYMSGWGLAMKNNGGYKLPKVLQGVSTKVIKTNLCRYLSRGHEYYRIYRELHICTVLSDYSSGCNGDSGGPMGCYDNDGNFRLLGITVFGKNPCGAKRGFPNVFVRVSTYRKWIARNAVGPVSM
ncbi:chymotrypsin-1-like isoform X2 [Mercenaria mercenaria]|uniref:chymotrypsin-1-like isoform X2 n=1 Tax=Mercenaria mercenaria TaxID=6596 RepID=UPI00234EB518|nr:chymotrypsin-1-like isoform X2 [Mercenaria mercenaria]